MKNILSLILSFLMVFAFVSCESTSKSEKYCSNCGKGISKSAAFCDSCGKSVDNEKVSSNVSSNVSSKNDISSSNSSKQDTNNSSNISKPSNSSKITSNIIASTITPPHTHSYSNYKCTGCGQVDKDGMFNCFRDWVIDKGTLNGDYVYYSKTADNYGGYASEDFSLYYWADTEQVEFCLHSVLDDDYSINFYIYIPKKYNGDYEYITSYYYRQTGEAVCESKGIIDGESFTKKHPLNSNKYTGSPDLQNDFMEMSRQGICDALDCLKQFLQKEKIGYSFSDLGFEKY